MEAIRNVTYEPVTLVLKDTDEAIAMRIALEVFSHPKLIELLRSMRAGLMADWMETYLLKFDSEKGLDLIDTLREAFGDEEMVRWMKINLQEVKQWQKQKRKREKLSQ